MSDDAGTAAADGGAGDGADEALAALTAIEGGGELAASDEEVRAAVEEAAEDLGESPAHVAEEVAHILTSGTGASTNEGVGGAAVGANSTAADDPRLEALELYRLQREL